MGSVACEQLFVDLVNSEWYDGRGRREDLLLDPRWRAEFLGEWGLGDPGIVSRRAIAKLTELRGILRMVVEDAHQGRPLSTLPLETFASALRPLTMRLEFVGEPSMPSWTPVRPSWTSVEAEIVRSCFVLLTGPARDRLGRCENEGCSWAFIDASRNGSRRWCDPAVCGNVSKVRAYRARHRG
jgi:predicted RNA-binding Zn ribbon-like protein